MRVKKYGVMSYKKRKVKSFPIKEIDSNCL